MGRGFQRVLVANRGEIALRVLRAVREAGLLGVAVYSEADAGSLHVGFADRAVCIGPGQSAKSYLNMEAVLDAARKTGAEAVHPGYGYLAENADFARACRDAGLVFIGPGPESLSLCGDKIAAREAVRAAGVPVVPASPGEVKSLDEARAIAREIGFPVMVKSAGGGGGRGIRVCADEVELAEEFAIAKAEAGAAFGNPAVYIEKKLIDPRHVEFQVLVDHEGNAVHLFERECSIQRRFQKLIEEAPGPAMTGALREKMGEAALAAARALAYENAGTVEFLLDAEGNFHFMEMNARIQVEHPVTECVTGVNLVAEQLRIAAGQGFSFRPEELSLKGHAIECRINAEDPDRGFLPSPGTVECLVLPGGFGVRVDTHLHTGYKLPVYYDSLLAKLVAFDRTREGALSIMRRALGEFAVEPIKTAIPLYRKILDDPDFASGDYHTGYLTRFVPEDDDEDDDED